MPDHHCVKPEPPPVRCDGHMRSTMTTFIPQPEQHLSPMHPMGYLSPQPPQGQLPWRPHHLPETLTRHPSPPNCFERTNFPVVKVLRGYPFRCEHSRGDSLFLRKQAQPYVLVRPSTRATRPPLSTVPTYVKIGHQTASMGGKKTQKLQVFAQAAHVRTLLLTAVKFHIPPSVISPLTSTPFTFTKVPTGGSRF